MPIQLNYTNSDTGFNAPASYWSLTDVRINLDGLIVSAFLGGYFTLAAKQAGKNPQLVRPIVATFAQLGITGATSLSAAATAIYTWALANDSFFAGGTIV